MKNLSNRSRLKNTSSRIPWHIAFVEALQMELRDYRDVLEFHAVTHNSAPLRGVGEQIQRSYGAQ
jgi:hypothetical protein